MQKELDYGDYVVSDAELVWNYLKEVYPAGATSREISEQVTLSCKQIHSAITNLKRGNRVVPGESRLSVLSGPHENITRKTIEFKVNPDRLDYKTRRRHVHKKGKKTKSLPPKSLPPKPLHASKNMLDDIAGMIAENAIMRQALEDIRTSITEVLKSTDPGNHNE